MKLRGSGGEVDGGPASSPMLPTTNPTANGSSGGKGGSGISPLDPSTRLRSTGTWQAKPRRSLLFERASSRWWNPQFSSSLLESQYWKCSFQPLRDRFRLGLIYIIFVALVWFIYHALFSKWSHVLPYQLACLAIIVVPIGILGFTFNHRHYQRFYLPTSFLCTFLVCVVSLLIFSLQQQPLISPVATFATSIEVVLLLYTVIPLPLYLCIIAGMSYSILFEILSATQRYTMGSPGVRLLLHLCIHMLGVHIFILSQVRQRKTFLKVGQSMLAREELKVEKQFKDTMIQSVMPKTVADELLKETNEMRRPSCHADSKIKCNVSGNAPQVAGVGEPGGGRLAVFRPFTMNLMQNVSILFADIAGFTKMSSNKSADELVSLLNDLFGRFDSLCGLLGCEKISTLGDCYYCVSGCPEARADHAKCCVEMGLSMCTEIRKFDEDRGQDVNMRVGIHTGTVMCGIVGTKRFKFDVFSNDVTLANDMESSGMAGRVHISEDTAQFLNDEYNLEESAPYDGKKTYFILSHKSTPLPSNTVSKALLMGSLPAALQEPRHESSDPDLNHSKLISAGKKIASKMRSATSLQNRAGSGSLRTKLLTAKPSQFCKEPAKKSQSLQVLSGSNAGINRPVSPDPGTVSKELANGTGGSSGGSNDLNGSRSSGLAELSEANSRALDSAIQLHHQSLTRFDTSHRDFDQRLADVIQHSNWISGGEWTTFVALNTCTLQFNDSDVEKEYRNHFAAGSVAPISMAMESQELTEGASGISPPKFSVIVDIVLAAASHILISAVAFYVFKLSSIAWIIYFGISALLLFLTVVIVVLPLLREGRLLSAVTMWTPRHFLGLFLILLPLGASLCNLMPCPKLDTNQSLRELDGDALECESLVSEQLICAYILFVVLFGHCNFSQLSCWPKIVVASIVSLVLILMAQFPVCKECVPDKNNTENATLVSFSVPVFSGSLAYRYEMIVDVGLALILICFLCYQFEASFRMSFFGDAQSRRDTESMQEMRDQADWLLTNIIPQHVIDLLKSDLKYSENHDNVAVVFASIVNWGDMYEESFEGGKEFLRVLNEIIGDFDDLLGRPEFNQVEKIKTIGSTYMVAAGLNPEKRRNSKNPELDHLHQLIEFSMALQDTLNTFNEDLLNFDFIMKLGFNVGPVTSGVIGTTKLYYDIWGDTVNIASRMYSTGVQGRVQIPDKVKKRLEDRYEFEYRDKIEVKGIDGGMHTYLLKGLKPNVPPLPI